MADLKLSQETNHITTFDGTERIRVVNGIGGVPNTGFVKLSQLVSPWANWTPSFTTSGSMTFTSVTVAYARYVMVGKMCSFAIRATGTVGGTVSGFIYVSTPVATKNLGASIAAAASIFDTVGNSVGRGFVIMDGTNKFGVAKQVSGYDGNFTAGSTTILISGQFELP